MSYKLGFYTTCSPLRGSRIAFWRHHDALWNILCRDYDLEIHVIQPVMGGDKYIERLYQGDHSVLYPTLKTQNITFHARKDTVPELDGLYLDDVHTYGETEHDVHEVLKEYIYEMATKNKPILLSDTDGFCTEILEGKQAAMMDLYEYTKSLTENYVVISPFINTKIPEKNRVVVPFEIDPDTMNKNIMPLSQRNYLCRMVANYYYREHYIPILNKLSGVGHVLVNGSGWNPYKGEMPSVEFKVGISMNPENVTTVYSQGAIGLVGRSSYNIKMNQSIYLYRWKEYLQAGIRIVPENVKEYVELLPDDHHTITVDDIMSYSNKGLHDAIYAISDAEYESIVEDQRETALEFLSVHKWVPVFKDLLGI